MSVLVVGGVLGVALSRCFGPLVVSCEFLASAMLHTCLKLRQPAAHAEKPIN